LPHLGGNLLPRRHKVFTRQVHRLLPQYAIIAHINSFQSQAQRIANPLVMSGHDPANVHFFSSLLQVHVCLGVFSRGREWANG